MDYGQPMGCNHDLMFCSCNDPEPEQRTIEEVIPAWLQKMFDGVDMSPPRLEPVTAQSFNRSVPTQPNGESVYPINFNPREFGSINALAGMFGADRFDEIKNNNLCKEINVQEPMERMEVTQENFFEMHELAKDNGYKGSAEEFRQALNSGEPIHLTRVVEPNPMKSALDAARALPGAPTGLDAVAFLETLSGLTGGAAEARGLGVAKPNQFPEVILKTADPATLTEYVSKTMVPAFMKEITELTEQFEGIELLRQQRRLQERLNKLMMYSTKPERIISNAIHDEHELAIFKCYIAQRVVAGQLDIMVGQTRINNARDGMLERKAAVVANQAKQKKEQERKALLENLQSQLFLLAEDVGKMELSTAAMYLRKLADNLGVEPEAIKPVTKKDLITKGVDAVKPIADAVKPYQSPLANMSQAERQGVIDSFRSAFVDAMVVPNDQGRIIAGLNRPLTEAEQALIQRLGAGFTNIPLWQGNQY